MGFSLAGLLRLRHIEQDVASGALAAANARANETSARDAQLRRKLGGTDDEVASIEVLRAVAASRASSQSMLAELEAVGRQHEAAVAEAQAAYNAARRSSKGLERLEEKHDLAAGTADRRSEQVALDEIASATVRNTPGSTPWR